ncbi:hypothetical protein O181_027433 [Austropuccinia psidii MF-1]|uniref:GAG-pre-integrase domain-containing protein n=1 Tax=Austropuccinia psidii MF-1 TaxID=1389203 RepID=A0A9Q3H0X8_9BASI|nr:hypothetical protein [Austropuccinia psidii MF-1]
MNDSPNSYTTLSEIKNLEKLNSLNFISWKRSIVASLGIRKLEHLLNPGKPDNEDLKQKQTVFYFIAGHLAAENYDKFVSKDSKDPSKLWCSIKEHYASTSAENVASHLGKTFSIKSPSSSSGLSESISLFHSTSKLLCSLSPNLFTGDVMPQVLAFYVLLMLPESSRHVSTAVFHSIKVSTKIPTVKEVFKEVEIDILQRTDTDKELSMALKATTKPNRHGCSNAVAPDESLFLNTNSTAKFLYVDNGAKLHVAAEATLQLTTSLGKLSLPNALVVPLASSILIPLGSFLNDGETLKGHKRGVNLFYKNNCLILTTQIVNNVLLINTPPVTRACVSIKPDPLMIHKQLGHPNTFAASKLFPNVDFSNVHCISCSLSKSH